MTSGTVQWFDIKRGIGFVLADNGEELFVNLANVRASDLETLIKDQRLDFDVHREPENNKAAAIRNIKLLKAT